FHLVACSIFAALAWLSHGGAAFSLIALAPWIVARMFRGERGGWLAAASVFLLLAVPWFAYQRFYDPPGDRLLKWHLAGQEAKDESVGAWQAIRESYRSKTWTEIGAAKTENMRTQLEGSFRGMFSVSPADQPQRRDDEFFKTVRGLTWWPLLALV